MLGHTGAGPDGGGPSWAGQARSRAMRTNARCQELSEETPRPTVSPNRPSVLCGRAGAGAAAVTQGLVLGRGGAAHPRRRGPFGLRHRPDGVTAASAGRSLRTAASFRGAWSPRGRSAQPHGRPGTRRSGGEEVFQPGFETVPARPLSAPGEAACEAQAPAHLGPHPPPIAGVRWG